MTAGFFRALIGVLVVAAVGLAVIPLLAALDLARGGSGFGVCPEGVWLCVSPYLPVLRLTGLVGLGMGAVAVGIRLARRGLRWAEREGRRPPGLGSAPPADRTRNPSLSRENHLDSPHPGAHPPPPPPLGGDALNRLPIRVCVPRYDLC